LDGTRYASGRWRLKFAAEGLGTARLGIDVDAVEGANADAASLRSKPAGIIYARVVKGSASGRLARAGQPLFH
jgi:hypothetical protein